MGFLLVAASAACFGALAILYRAALADGADAWTILALRFAGAAVLVGIVARARRAPRPRGRTLVALALLGGVGYVGHSVLYLEAVQRAPAGLVALLFYLYPVLVTLLAAAFLREPLTRGRVLCLLGATAGLLLVAGPAGSASAAGIALSLGCALVYGVYLVLCGKYAKEAGGLASTAVVLAAGALVFASIALVRGPVWPGSASGWMAVAAIAVVCTAAAIGLLFAGLERIGAARASVAATLEPLVTVALAAAFLGERLGPLQIAGGALIVASVVALARLGR